MPVVEDVEPRTRVLNDKQRTEHEHPLQEMFMECEIIIISVLHPHSCLKTNHWQKFQPACENDESR